MDKILYIAAAIAFGIAALKLSQRLDFVALGFCLLTASLIV